MILQIILFFAGLAGLFLGAEWLVKGASRFASSFNIKPVVIGLTIVAFGTSTPELVTSVIAVGTSIPEIATSMVVQIIILISKNRHKLRFHNTAEDITSGYDPHEIIVPHYRHTDNIMFHHKVYDLFNGGIFGDTNGIL